MLSPEFYNRQCLPDRRPLLMWTIVLAVSLLLVALIVTAPIALAGKHGLVAASLYQAFSHACHQQADRSFFMVGQPLAVCARCTGIYFGFALTTLSYPLLTSLHRTDPPELKWLFIASAPLAIDFGLGALGIWENTLWSRGITGMLFGGVVVLFVMPALAQLSHRFRKSAPLWRAPAKRSGDGALAK